MQSIGDIILQIASKDNSCEGDYTDSDGYLVCGKCHTRKQHEIDWPVDGGTVKKRVPVTCECRRKELDEEKAADERRQFEQQLERLRKDGISDPKYFKYRFDLDDGKQPKVTDVCKRYVTNWPEMRKNNIGILFYGTVGTGKSFMACCIANALLEKLVTVSVTNFPRILNRLQGFDDEKQAFIDSLQRYDLLVIDDLGVERGTSYAAEQVYNVIDTRTRSGKPLIITTNLTVAEMENPADMQYKRIYDRVLEMCSIQLNMSGMSRRGSNADERRRLARNLLKGENPNDTSSHEPTDKPL